ncbi:MAG: protein TctC [Comamonadaceae bacterium CG1_02_60_18]|nr:MAG: protein TctC [Comamonadaceae bacterium CG1_02_60_18]PIQ50600.1 MAG: protein TctC [Comamonadaceae bacterium CG12_big_fil_rev_8_21_14_0_65_59_15]
MTLRRTVLAAAVAAAALTTTFGIAHAADWPTRPVQVIVPAGAGGDTDFNARTMARFFEKVTGKPMVVTNVKGGSGTIGMSQVENATPDGNTLFFAHTGIVIVNEVSGMIDRKFDSKLDIACIPAVDKGMVLISGKKSGFKSVSQVLEKAKAAPNTVIYGTEMGGYSHLQGLIFQKKSGIQMKFVDVGSASDKITSLLGGRIDLASISYGPVQDYAKTGDMAMVAQYNDVANPLLGSIKTFKDQGMSLDMGKPYIIAFPKGTSPVIIKKMADVMQQITKDPAYAKALEDGFKQPVSFYHTKEANDVLNRVRTDFLQYKDLLQQKK